MNEYSKELCHWGIKLGAEREGHKYVARVEGRKPGSYIYFYDLDQYNRWKSGAKNAIKEGTQKLKNKANEINSNTRAAARNAISGLFNRLKASKTSITDAAMKYADTVKKASRDAAARIQRTVTDTVDRGTKPLRTYANTAKSKSENAVRNVTDTVKTFVDRISSVKPTSYKGNPSTQSKVKSFISNLFGSYVNALGNGLYKVMHFRDNENNTPAITPNTSRDSKYVAKLDYPDGHTKYIKNKDQWSRYTEIVKYQNNEPEFMHSVKEIEPDDNGDFPSIAADRSAVNKPSNDDGSVSYRGVNCTFCSTAYELRRRGYDVEAPNIPADILPTNLSKLYDVKDSEMTTKVSYVKSSQKITGKNAYGITSLDHVEKDSTGKEVMVYKVEHYDLNNNDKNVKSFVPCNTVDDAYSSIGSDNWKKQIEKQFNDMSREYPNGARGMLNVYWAQGGGHSIVWEKNDSGKIEIFDTQTNTELTLTDLMASVSPAAPVLFVRTDDLKLNPGILSRTKSK